MNLLVDFVIVDEDCDDVDIDGEDVDGDGDDDGDGNDGDHLADCQGERVSWVKGGQPDQQLLFGREAKDGDDSNDDDDNSDDHLAGTRVEGEDRGRRSLFPPSGFSDNHHS